jgi:hypothetical protein
LEYRRRITLGEKKECLEKKLQDFMAMADEKPYTIHSPRKITLSEDARFWAKEHGFVGKRGLEEFARYLLNKEKLKEANGKS